MEDLRQRLLILKGSRSIKDFANVLDLPISTVYYYLNGREPPVSFIKRVSDRLGVREEWLLTGKEPIFKNEEYHEEPLNEIVEFLKQRWRHWPEKKRNWFEIQFRRLLPEFEEWLRGRMTES